MNFIEQLDEIKSKLHGSFDSMGEDKDRFHIIGYRLKEPGVNVGLVHDGTGAVFMGVMLGSRSHTAAGLRRALKILRIPFTPYDRFHFDECHVWIFRAGEGIARIEIRCPVPAPYNPGKEVEAVFGMRVSEADLSEYLVPIE